ncbi:4Fe-4S binding protein [Gordonibacter urolithinfaciens]|uniref:4Fe-4S binding protein n=1 Tax=Gordonibacter urolithinfaciens TaxID=1335613 RepID=UPI000F4BC232|nr:4Fe-4S binding protein [Gordonibacter urolithinfaciens]ROT91272.1 oxidoreductase [Gordonibacter urolithinfaciens]GKG89917.1 oxidoreductase [Gordonibacter pamelaeae]
MTEYGMLIDYEWCTGCHSCETACQMEHHLPVGQFGIKLNEIGPFEYAPDRWQLSYVPVPTDLCDFCAERQAKGKLPTCQHHCQAQCLEVGPLDELAEKVKEKRKLVLFHR